MGIDGCVDRIVVHMEQKESVKMDNRGHGIVEYIIGISVLIILLCIFKSKIVECLENILKWRTAGWM